MLFNGLFFEKHQTKLLKLANSKWTRWLLGLNRLPKHLKEWKIEKITPNSIHRRVVNGKTFKVEWEAAFFSRPRFAESIAFNLSPFVYFQGMKRPQFSPVGVTGAALLLFALRKGYWQYGFGLMGTTTNFSPSSDGALLYYSSVTWSTVHDAASATHINNDGGGTERISVNYYSNAYNITRGFFNFDTSSIPDDATSISAIMNLYGHSTNVTDSNRFTCIYGSTAATTISKDDYDACGTTAYSDSILQKDTTINGWNSFTFNSTGNAAISKTGLTKVCGREGHYDVGNTPPSDDKYVYFRYSAYTGTTYDPYLAVTYTPSITSPTVTTSACSDITPTTATGNGNITATGGENCTRRGFCYKTGSSGDPTTADSVAYDDGDFGTGAFTKGLTGLSSATAYRVRAYAVNSVGTSYGSTVDLTTATAHTKSVSETINFSEALAKIHGCVRAFSETLNASDAFARTAQFRRSFSETTQFSEVLAKIKAMAIAFSETIGFSDVVSKSLVFLRSFTETVAFSEVKTFVRNFVRSFTETVDFSESIGKVKMFVRTFSETIGFSEAVAKASSFARSFSESVGISDIVRKFGGLWTKEDDVNTTWNKENDPADSS